MKQLVIYQAKNGKIEFRGDFERDTIWASQKQIASIFEIDRTVVNRHIRNIFKDKELNESQVCAKFAHTTQHGAIKGKTQTKQMQFYNLDIILAVGYRTNSSRAIEFRKWATNILKQHLVDGFTINKKRIKVNYQAFENAVASIRTLIPDTSEITTKKVLDLINIFANTWVSLDAYDKQSFPKKGISKKSIQITTDSLLDVLGKFKRELIIKKQATDIFARERSTKSIEGIIGNIFQSFGGRDVYQTNEEKAANFLYLIVKNHPFVDGNKRSAAFTFVWYLNEAKLLKDNLSPEALTTLTLLIAESNSGDKEKMIGLVLLLLGKN